MLLNIERIFRPYLKITLMSNFLQTHQMSSLTPATKGIITRSGLALPSTCRQLAVAYINLFNWLVPCKHMCEHSENPDQVDKCV